MKKLIITIAFLLTLNFGFSQTQVIKTNFTEKTVSINSEKYTFEKMYQTNNLIYGYALNRSGQKSFIIVCFLNGKTEIRVIYQNFQLKYYF